MQIGIKHRVIRVDVVLRDVLPEPNVGHAKHPTTQPTNPFGSLDVMRQSVMRSIVKCRATKVPHTKTQANRVTPATNTSEPSGQRHAVENSCCNEPDDHGPVVGCFNSIESTICANDTLHVVVHGCVAPVAESGWSRWSVVDLILLHCGADVLRLE